MKKSCPKLTICRETLRVLGELELGGARGGLDTVLPDGCRKVVLVDSAGGGTGCPPPVKP